MRPLAYRLLPLATALSLAASARAQQPALAGLWKAQRTFGHDARGPLLIERRGDRYLADFLGKSIAVRADSGALTFQLADSAGRFRGRIVGRAIEGHWFPAPSPTGANLATPVVLRQVSPTRWTGAVTPAEDTFTFYLNLAPAPDGSLSAFLRNPERDQGTIWGVERLVVDGTRLRLVGRRRGQGEESEVAVGTWDAEGQSFTLGFPGRGGSYDFHREGEASAFYPRGLRAPAYQYAAPLARDDGWMTANAADVGLDVTAVNTLVQRLLDMPMANGHTLQLDALLVARHGKLVVEEYFHGHHRDRLHETRSAAKSMTATLIGAAMHASAPLALASPVYRVMNGGVEPANLELRKRAMTLEHLLTMSGGYHCDDNDDRAPGNENRMWDETPDPDFYRHTLALPMAFAPGDTSIYCSINPNLALGMLGRAAGESPLALFDRLLARPLKIERYGWTLDPVGHPYGGGGVRFTARDFLKMGQLMLDGGVWKGTRILGKEYVVRASAPRVRIQGRAYGYLWWGMDYPWNGRTVHAYAALGAGGQDVIVVPELGLVVLSYASNYGDRISRDIQGRFMTQELLPAVKALR